MRAKLRVVAEKGYVSHVQDGPGYLYRPVLQQENATQTALTDLLPTFFAGSVEQTVAALLRLREVDLSEAELDRLFQLIDGYRPEQD